MEKLLRLTRSGFTLVELLVVIAIIGILAAVLMANFNDARMAARDEARKSALKEMQLAIELYKSQNGRYPEAGCGRGGAWTSAASTYGGCNEYIAGLAPEYISDLPIDTAVSNAANQGYLYRTNGQGTVYQLMAFRSVESKMVTSYDDEFARCPRSFGVGYCSDTGPQTNTYAVYSLGAEGW